MKIKNMLPAVRSGREQDIEHPFYSLQREMNNLFDSFFRGFDIAPRRFYDSVLKGFSPSVDVKENDKEFIIRAELPGVEEKDVEVTVTNDSVTIKGEKKEEREDKDKNYYYMERAYGSFHRVIPLTAEIEVNKAEASFKNGVMDIKIPKSQSVQAKGIKIPIKAG
ncbi:MAG: Hsp20/alpha crystallin family protein [Smithellaceae bacterium]|jgi:HSP20 family protein|nr:Hsp20/alpha crystallin family protein [Syntrophaceae bacterium]MBP8609551.1 Hsp20/alpha crystallin family protein [Syntrophaceae bacterium]NMD04772.1 Hsp20/alpha crystallin family protein [Deltaproteobacteria bacterium]